LSNFSDDLRQKSVEYGYSLNNTMIEKMEHYYMGLAAANKVMNLTAVTEAEEAVVKHFLDSIVPCRRLPEGGLVVDVGSGAGFPIVPLKVVRPDIRAVAMESSAKKSNFIATTSKETGIDISVINERAEDVGRGPLRETFDVCTSRAVATLRVLLELCSPLVKRGGLVIAYKGRYQTELEEAKNAVMLLGLELEEVIKLPCTELDHSALLFRKTALTAEKYPRSFARIKKNPL